MPIDDILKGVAGMAGGGVIGAYLATSAIRWGRMQGASLGRSHCDTCQKLLGWHETVPVVSFLCLGGKCSQCKAPIDPFHLIGEIIAGLIVGAIFAFRPWPEAGLEALAGLLLLWLALIDLKTFRLPNALVMVVAGLGAIHAYLENELMLSVLVAIGVGVLLSGIAYGLYRVKGQAALGPGDIKLLMALSLWLGLNIVYVMILACVIGLVHLALVQKRLEAPPKIAFGPALAASGVIIALLSANMGAYAYG